MTLERHSAVPAWRRLTMTALALLRRGQPIVHRWLAAYVSPALALAIAISGLGAWVSLPLLLVWVTGVGVVLGRPR